MKEGGGVQLLINQELGFWLTGNEKKRGKVGGGEGVMQKCMLGYRCRIAYIAKSNKESEMCLGGWGS